MPPFFSGEFGVRLMIERVTVQLDSRSYPILVGTGAWEAAVQHIWTGRPGRIALVSDEKVAGLYGEEVRRILRTVEPDPLFLTVPQGEGSKSFSRLEDLCRQMAVAGLDRDSLLLALGGGVVGDLAGLAASTYLRGIRLIQMPTTLLAMVDSSVGGKTGINIPEGKNLVGTFYQPTAVFAEVRSLRTLEERDWYSGLAEAVKIAVTLDEELFGYLEKTEDLGPGGGMDISRVIVASCRNKADVVRRDEREGGIRKVLNFGHTLAHGFEGALGYGKIRHGEAVVLGMKAALALSVRMCGLAEDEYFRVTGILDRIPVPEVDLAPERLEVFLRRDKKSFQGSIQAVLLRAIGKPEFVSLKDPGQLLQALAERPGRA